jgi:hypothetical protein
LAVWTEGWAVRDPPTCFLPFQFVSKRRPPISLCIAQNDARLETVVEVERREAAVAVTEATVEHVLGDVICNCISLVRN